MTHTEYNRPARRRGEMTNDRGSRRIAAAINAQRRQKRRRPDGAPIKSDSFAPSDSRHAYLTRVHD
jgi:hypothetical protein